MPAAARFRWKMEEIDAFGRARPKAGNSTTVNISLSTPREKVPPRNRSSSRDRGRSPPQRRESKFARRDRSPPRRERSWDQRDNSRDRPSSRHVEYYGTLIS
ncbi:hypothetical protein EON65_06495 [archaeon]|nr:MAG: hypothetical protein EON65_06495 [archaeon]